MHRSILPALYLALCMSTPALAQRTTATLRGTVVDASKALVPGVTVTARNDDTGLTRTTVTNDWGTYALLDLPIGTYRVNAELQGFKAASRTGIILRVADDYVADFTLAAGDVTEVVTVEASRTPVKVIGGDVSGVITGEQARELPLNGRNFLQLATLTPGVSAPDFFNVKDKGALAGVSLSVSGSAVTGNMWTVDGANNNDVGSNASILVYPSLDAIEEFKILRNSYGPEFGGAGGAQINVVTRGGTNRFRGSGFYAVRHDVFNSTDYFLKRNNQPKGELQRNDFGGFIGGPIFKNRLFSFGGFEWNLENRGSTRVAQVPTLAERTGDFSAGPICSTAPGIPVDPTTGEPFDGNGIPSERISPAGQAFLSLFPLPNVAPVAGSCNNWVTSVTSPIEYSQQHIRGDWIIGNSTRLMARYIHHSWKNDSPSLQSHLWGDDPFPSVDSNWNQPSASFVMSLNQTLGARATNSLQFSYSANRITVRRGGDDPELNARIVAAIPPIFPVDSKQHGADIGHPLWWGGSGYPALWNEAPFDNNQDLFVLKDDYARVFGQHFIKAGALVSFNKKNEDTIGNGSAENQVFWGSTGFNGFGGTTGNILADFLLKDMAFGFSELSAGRQAPQRWQDAEFYIADSWEVSAHLTFDYGIRYSIYFNAYTADDRITSFVPALFDAGLGADPCNGNLQPPGSNWCKDANARGGIDGPNRSLMFQDYNNFAPRLGVAWDLKGDGKTAIRAGIGQFFQRERLSPTLSLALNTPFVRTISGARKLDTNEEPCAGCFSQSLGTPTRGHEVELRTPNNWQWNLMFQREVWRNTTIEAGYVGSYGYNLLRNYNANQVLAGDTDSNGVDDRVQYANTVPANGGLRPFGVFGDTQIIVWDHSGESTYHSFQTQFISRFGRSSQFQASYTYARSRANFNLTDTGQGLNPGLTALDNHNPGHDWGRPDLGRTNIFNASLVYLLPSLDGKSVLTRGLLGNWELATIVSAATGEPFTAYTGSIPGLNGGPSGTGYTDNQRPNRTSESCNANGGPDEQIINPGAYTLNGFQLGSIGSARRGDCTGPGYFQADVAIYKNVQVTDGVRLQFRWDIFNFFNNTNFRGVNAVLQPSSAVLDNPAPNATVIESAAIPSSFGQAGSTRDPREMQFGLKIIW